ncbi:MAG TPA: pentapeptide repeat-containing protein [Tepidisphaeraceae bacterium]|nr:pentapeptide repeat-containing protein [Tepidisphaeraceae bacterium]
MSIAEMELRNNRAVVAPRVRCEDHCEEVRLVDRVEMMLRRGIGGEYDLYGSSGCGKTTAIRELARAFADDDRLKLVDDCLTVKSETRATKLVIFTSRVRAGPMAMELMPWTRDEWIEYMLARWRGQCSAVMPRVLNDSYAERLAGNAQLWAGVLDEMAQSGPSLDLRTALRRRVAKAALTPQRHAEMAALCVRFLTRQIPDSQLPFTAVPGEQDFARLLRHRPVQVLLASDMLVHWLADVGDTRSLDGMWPAELVVEAALQLKQRNGTAEILESVLESNELRLHPVAASLLLALEPSWRPAPRYVPNLASAQLRKARWQHVDLFRARLGGCDLRSADLREARLQRAKAVKVKLGRGDLRGAIMRSIDAESGDFAAATLSGAIAQRARFAHANLEGANLQGAKLRKAEFVGANLKRANLRWADLRRAHLKNAALEGADFSGADLTKAVFASAVLRETSLAGAKLRKAWLVGCNLEGMDLTGMDLSGAVLSMALLTGASLAGANLYKASLQKAGLAEIDLEGADLRRADLRGASFHLGSTRSGLVGSVIPCEGSRTGFYTDEREEQSYRRPEEIRKANLCNADLRGANIRGVDFYLVDVRGARYTHRQGKYLKRCGAIMR